METENLENTIKEYDEAFKNKLLNDDIDDINKIKFFKQ